jgi:hypothetical protein
MTADIFSWWLFLCVVSGLNVLAWSQAAAALVRRSATLSPAVAAARRLQLLLSAGYVLGCAFRSVFPVFDVPRLALFDTWLSSVAVGRSVATFAELCFAAQWALLLHEYANTAGSRLGKAAAAAAVPLIVVAESFSWYSVLSTSNLGHVVEESLWGLCAALIAMTLFAIGPRSDRSLRRLLAAWCVSSLIYAAYMFLVDVPMYWARWLADEANGRAYLSIAHGLRDVSERWVVSHRWEDWQSEMIWMSLYFSVGVWVSISLIHAPPYRQNAPAARGGFPKLAMARGNAGSRRDRR